MVFRIEQYAEADLLTVMLFADGWFIMKYKGLWFGKKACQLAQAAELYRYAYYP